MTIDEAAMLEAVARAIHENGFKYYHARMGISPATFEQVWNGSPETRKTLEAQALAAMQEVQRRVSGAGWMGIESAPRDGSEIDIYGAFGRHTDVYWDLKREEWRYKDAEFGSMKCTCQAPTHWQRPAPPESRGTGGLR